MRINFLEAYNGDAIHISFADNEVTRHILVDGGTAATYGKNVKKKIEYGALYSLVEEIKKNGEYIDLLIVTHVDDDHIGGILNWLSKEPGDLNVIKKIWFNSGKIIKAALEGADELSNEMEVVNLEGQSLNTSIGQGITFEKIISRQPEKVNSTIVVAGTTHTIGDAFIDVLSPRRDNLELLLTKWEKEDAGHLDTSSLTTDYQHSLRHFVGEEVDVFKEDSAVHNGSSIAFLLTLHGRKYLFLSDAHPSVIVAALKERGYTSSQPCNCSLIKLSHHGSMYNNSPELLSLINAETYVISTNGESHGHPHKALIGRLLKVKGTPMLHFNYPAIIDRIFMAEDFDAFPYLKGLSKQNQEFNY